MKLNGCRPGYSINRIIKAIIMGEDLPKIDCVLFHIIQYFRKYFSVVRLNKGKNTLKMELT